MLSLGIFYPSQPSQLTQTIVFNLAFAEKAQRNITQKSKRKAKWMQTWCFCGMFMWSDKVYIFCGLFVGLGQFQSMNL